MSHNQLLLIPIKDLANKTFVIGGYQRGYKWGKKEILELLSDIDTYEQGQGLYCLQPLILKPFGDDLQKIVESNIQLSIKNEVVDGQQRSTTIYLILKYLAYKNWIDEDYLFEIDFQTRKRSGEFLKKHLDQIYKLSLETIDKSEFSDQNYEDVDELNLLWKAFIQDHYDFNNVDVYHFFTVTCYLIRWMDIHLDDGVNRKLFIEKLTESVKVIWYTLEDTQKEDQIIKVFLNNNKGKISLTSSELIKALFILDIKNNEPATLATLQINQFATEWDMVEKHLQEDRFWYFIQPNESKYNQGTRIDFLFDLDLNKQDKSDDFFAYRHFESLFNKNEEIKSDWEKLIKLYYKLFNWFEDPVLYHLVGFITNSKIKSLGQILEESKGKTRDKLKNELEKIIIDQFKKKKKDKEGVEMFVYALENLHYKNLYKETLTILLLYNVLYYLENMAGYKFPFDLFVKQNWSIEHINPQNPKDLGDISLYKQWVKDMMLYSDEKIDEDLITEMDQFNDLGELTKNKALLAKLDLFINNNEEITHSISNLLLLDKNTNSALGNKLFKEKRKTILRFDINGHNDKKEAVFIPVETLNAFNKTFSTDINIENWTKEDRDKYYQAIQERLKDFLPKINDDGAN